MSSANNNEQGKLEEEFRSRMHDAEVTSAPDLWNRIDHELTVNENREYKGRIVLYKQLAAACFVLFLLAGALLTFEIKNDPAIPGNAGTEPGIVYQDKLAAGKPSDNTPEISSTTNAGSPAESAVSASRAGAGSPAAPHPGRRTAAGMVAGAAMQQPTKKQPAGNRTSVKAGELPRFQAENVQATAMAGGITESGQNNEASAIYSIPDAAAERGKAEPDKQAVQQMLRNAGAVMAMAKDQNLLKNQTARASGVSMQTDIQAEVLKKNVDSFSSADKKAAGATGRGDSRMSLGMAYSPAYFHQNIGLPDQAMQPVNQSSFAAAGSRATADAAGKMEAARNEFEDNTDAAFSYAVEARTGIRLAKKWTLLTGIGYSRNSARTKTSYVIRQFWFRPNSRQPHELSPTVYLPSLHNSAATDSISVEQTNPFYVNYAYKLLSVPLGLQFESKIAKEWYWYAAGGVAANFNLGSEIAATSPEIGSVRYTSRDNDSPFRKVQCSGNVGVGVGKRLSESVMVVVGPEFRSFFSSLLARPDDAPAPQGKPYTIGVNMGIQYSLGKK